MRRAIDWIVDEGSFFELTPGYGRTQITGFARLAGHPVGVFANDPMFYAGAMGAEGAQKVARFLRFCETFHLPLISLVDEPGFMIGLDSEQAGTIRYGVRAMSAINQSSVPWCTAGSRTWMRCARICLPIRCFRFRPTGSNSKFSPGKYRFRRMAR